jgi:hypothetical protein
MIKKSILLILLCFTLGIASTSCSKSDDEIVNPTVNSETGGDEIDDPAEPDEDD